MVFQTLTILRLHKSIIDIKLVEPQKPDIPLSVAVAAQITKVYTQTGKPIPNQTSMDVKNQVKDLKTTNQGQTQTITK